MKVFVTGVTGYIGAAVAGAFRRGGHQVWGLIRNTRQAPFLDRHEIHPVVGDLRDPDSYRKVAQECDTLIHCAADYRGDWAESDQQTVDVMLAVGRQGRTRTVVFTSGSWVYGDTGGRPVDESASPASRMSVGAHRPAVERMLLDAKHVRGLVIRPANVYGRRGGMTGDWFSSALSGKAPTAPGNGQNHWPMVHVDDLAAGYLFAVESGRGGEVFHFADHSRSTLLELLTAAMRAAGSTAAVELVPMAKAAELMGAYAQVYSMDYLLDSGRAERLLRWKPKHEGFVGEAPTYFKSWKAWQELKDAAEKLSLATSHQDR